MKPLLYVDGYNIIGAWPKANHEQWPLDECRDRLIHLLQDYAGYTGQEVCVVFDGYKYTRDQVFERLMAHDVMARMYFYPLTNAMSCYCDLPTAGADKTPVAAYIADRVLTLPLYADLGAEDVARICELVCS